MNVKLALTIVALMLTVQTLPGLLPVHADMAMKVMELYAQVCIFDEINH